MKASLACALLAAVSCLSARANLALPRIEIHSQLAHEAVEIKIEGDEAVVTGTFKFVKSVDDYYDLTLYLPVYAVEGTPEAQMKPEISLGEQKLDVHFIKKEWETNRDIQGFGELPQLEGQRVYWFLVSHLPQQPGQKEFTLTIRYTQKLAKGKFIYTPLIPHQKKDVDYGSITVSADRPLSLIDADKHSFEKDGDKFVIDPADKRAIIVAAAKAGAKIP